MGYLRDFRLTLSGLWRAKFWKNTIVLPLPLTLVLLLKCILRLVFQILYLSDSKRTTVFELVEYLQLHMKNILTNSWKRSWFLTIPKTTKTTLQFWTSHAHKLCYVCIFKYICLHRMLKIPLAKSSIFIIFSI